MSGCGYFDRYPFWIVVFSNIVSLGMYFIGSYIIYQLGAVWLAIYVFYIVILELRLMKRSCTGCYYYGRLCAFGRGKLSAAMFEKGDMRKFSQGKVNWKDLIPDFMVSIIPLVVGIASLVMEFNLLILVLVVLLLALTSFGNGFVRGSLACRHCRQRSIGCPAEKMFSKK